MVICIVALVVFSFLGIWSARYRRLARQAFGCAIKMITLRPCDVGLETKIKTRITAKLMRVPPMARFFYRHFKTISMIFTVAFFLSLAGVFYGIYNFVAFGNCNGPQSSGFCIYNALTPATVSPKDIVIGTHPIRGSASANLTIIEFACLQCPYSKSAEPIIGQILDSYSGRVNLAFFFFPLPQHLHGKLAATADYCAGEQGRFWEYHDLLFQLQDRFDNNVTDGQASSTINYAAQQVSLDMTRFSVCMDSDYAKQKVQSDIDLGNKLGITGTPTFFIGNDKIVGPQPYSEFQSLIEQNLAK